MVPPSSLTRSRGTALAAPTSQILQVEKGNCPAAGELWERAIPPLDRLVLDEQGRERLLQELVRLGLRLGLDENRLRVTLGLGDLRLGERLLALQLVVGLLRVLLSPHFLLHLLLDHVRQVACPEVHLV